MCLAVPARIQEIKPNDLAVVEIQGNQREVSVCLLENPQVGEFVLIHAGFAIERVDEATAKQIFEDLEGLG